MGDINELLANGYFRTARGRSPAKPVHSPTTVYHPSFLRAHTESSSFSPVRSRSRGPASPPPPRPIVEDEETSLAKEQFGDIPCYDPPAKGVIEQHPIILEADISEGEAAKLHEEEVRPLENSGERRYVFIPGTGTPSSNSEDEVKKLKQRKRDSGKSFRQELPVREKETILPRDVPPLEKRNVQQDTLKEKATPLMPTPPLERRKSRQDLPSLETKVPRDIPPQFRRTASAYTTTPTGSTPKSGSGTRTPAGEYFLSPEMMRGSKDNFTPSQSAPRYGTSDFGGRARPPNEKRNSESFPSTRPETPNSEKRTSGHFESSKPSRRGSGEREKPEKLTRPQQLVEETHRRSDRPPLPARQSTARSSRSSKYYSSSEDDLSDSDSDRRRRRKHTSHQLHPGEHHHHQRSSSKSSTTHRPLKPTSRFTSPLPSPKVSPSQLPDEFGRSGTFPLMKKSNSRSSSPTGYRDQRQEKPSSRPGSRQSSQAFPTMTPIQLPTADDFRRSGTFPTKRPDSRPSSPSSREGKLNPFEGPSRRPHSRQSSQTSLPVPMPMPIPFDNQSTASLPIPIPSRVDVYSPEETRRTPVIPQYEDRSSTVRPAEKPLWQPPKFQPPTHLEKPIGSYRRYSEDLERGAVTPLAACPRKTFVRGRNDWLTLPQCPGFDICPSCYNSTMLPTEFRNMFIPAPIRSPDIEVQCDFGSSPWYRIAWLLTLKERRRDLNLFYGLANVTNTIKPCTGSHSAMRQWHSILDPKTNTPIRNFDVCTSCVRSIEVLLPATRGIFVRTDVHLTSSVPRICDLRFDSKRFVQYFDALETTADATTQSSYPDLPPDTRPLASLIRRYAAIEECQKDADLRDARWHLITQLPEFTVCPECFDEVVWPELSTRTNPKAIPLMFHKSVQRLPGRASCQLYSERMREIFKTAVDTDDYKLLASKVRERRAREAALKGEMVELRRLVGANPGNRRLEGELEGFKEEWKKWE